MNSETALEYSDYENHHAVIKKFLNSINDSLRLMTIEGYDTKDLYTLYDMLRYEVLSDKGIRLLFEQGLIEEYIIKLNTFNALLTDLTKQLKENRTSLMETKDEKKELEKNRPQYDKRYVDYHAVIGSTIGALITLLPIGAGIFAEKELARYTFNSPQVIEYTVSSDGKSEESIKYDRNHSDNLTIKVYSANDNSGFRLQETYVIENGKSITSDQLNSIDLSSLEPIDTRLVSESEFANIPQGEYRVANFEIFNEDIIGRTTDVDPFLFVLETILIVCLTILLLIGIAALSEIFNVYAFFDVDEYGNIYHNLINLSKYKIALRKYLKQMDLNDKEKKKYEKLINTLCNRIDKVVVQCTEELANIDYMKQIHIEKEAKQKASKFKAIKTEKEKVNKDNIEKIASLIKTLNKEISSLSNNEGNEVKELLHSIQIKESVLFEKEDDHLKIRSGFIPILKFLDLSLIDFSNVDIRYIDFRDSNAVINLQKVYGKSAEYAKFDDVNIYDWSNYKGVNLTGSKLDENLSTMVNLKDAIVSKETVLKR